MKELIKIKEVNGVNFVSSLKELYLDVGMDKSNWASWLKRNVKDNTFFSESQDYQLFVVTTSGRNSEDCACTLDMGKHLVVQMPTDNAHNYRQYLIDYEKKNPLDILLSMNKESLAMTCLQLTTVIKEKDELIEQKEVQLIEQAPKVEFADKLLKSKANILIGDFAKVMCDEGYNIGEGRLFEWLRVNKYIYKEHSFNKPYQSFVDRGYFVTKTTPIKSAYRDFISITTLITPIGQVYLYNKLKDEVKFNKNK